MISVWPQVSPPLLGHILASLAEGADPSVGDELADVVLRALPGRPDTALEAKAPMLDRIASLRSAAADFLSRMDAWIEDFYVAYDDLERASSLLRRAALAGSVAVFQEASADIPFQVGGSSRLVRLAPEYFDAPITIGPMEIWAVGPFGEREDRLEGRLLLDGTEVFEHWPNPDPSGYWTSKDTPTRSAASFRDRGGRRPLPEREAALREMRSRIAAGTFPIEPRDQLKAMMDWLAENYVRPPGETTVRRWHRDLMSQLGSA